MKFVAALALSLLCTAAFAQKQIAVKSPNGKLQIEVSVGQIVTYSLQHDGDLMIAESPISMTLVDGSTFGVKPKLKNCKMEHFSGTIESPVYKRYEINDEYNELVLTFKGDYKILFRAYDEGMAYRFVSTSKKPFKVEKEQATFNFSSDNNAYIPYVRSKEGSTFGQQFHNSFENIYTYVSLSKMDKNKLAFLPIVVEGTHDKKMLISESDLLNYPGMYLNNAEGRTCLKAVFASSPKEEGVNMTREGYDQPVEPYIAKFEKGEAFPWRIIVVAENDIQLADNNMVYKLATPSLISDVSWIKPGLVSWDWWSAWNTYGVNFRAGINNDTYKYYIDFASKEGIPYILLDAGWTVSGQNDLKKVIPEIDLKELISYGKNKNVDLILWVDYPLFVLDVEGVSKYYSEMGIKGFKLDHMNRDDQKMIAFQRHVAEVAAKYNLFVDFHGTSKPAGLNRTYPNVLNYEGVDGLEIVKWTPKIDHVTYDVTIPFIRMAAGPIDYTQGAMRNSTKNNYIAVSSEPVSQGTRCRQIAEYVVFESPLNMLCDNPSNYLREEECTHFIADIPTVWDETKVLNGKVAKYITFARRKGESWYIGSLTNWDKRDMNLDLSFLGNGSFKAEIFRDGVNADRVARDYIHESINLPSDKKLKISMASGGGFAIKITKQ